MCIRDSLNTSIAYSYCGNNFRNFYAPISTIRLWAAWMFSSVTLILGRHWWYWFSSFLSRKKIVPMEYLHLWKCLFTVLYSKSHQNSGRFNAFYGKKFDYDALCNGRTSLFVLLRHCATDEMSGRGTDFRHPHHYPLKAAQCSVHLMSRWTIIPVHSWSTPINYSKSTLEFSVSLFMACSHKRIIPKVPSKQCREDYRANVSGYHPQQVVLAISTN